ncbi:MAG: DedA family protein [Streptosporangiales bacterium]|nr:DedA family protein [Streptosporangiales bacterium]
MEDQLLSYLMPAVSSPWLYLVILLLAAIDGVFPLVPSESVVITAGAFATATGQPNLLAVVVVAAAGAYLGDNTAYLLGRFAERRLAGRLWRSPRRARIHEWAQHALQERGGQMIIVARFLPGGRVAASLSAGALGYPGPSYRAYAAVAAVIWGTYSAMLGYVGGVAFQEHPLRGMLLGLAIGMALTVLIEVARRVRSRVQLRRAPGQEYTSTTLANPRSTSASSSETSSSAHTTTSCASPRASDSAVAASTSPPRCPPVTRSTNPVVPPGP